MNTDNQQHNQAVPPPEEGMPEQYNLNDDTDPNLCIACQDREKDLHDNPYSELCTSCRQHYIRYPISRWVYLILALIAILLVISIRNIPLSITDLKAYQKAAVKYDDKYYYDSLVLYDELYQKYPDSVPIAINLVQACMKQQNFYYAAFVIDNSLAGREINESEYNLLEQTVELLDRYFIAFTKADEIFFQRG